MPESIDPVFVKTSPKRSFLIIENNRFGLVVAKTGSINSGTRRPYTAGGRKEYTLDVYTAGSRNEYTLDVHTAGGRKEYILDVHTTGGRKEYSLPGSPYCWW